MPRDEVAECADQEALLEVRGLGFAYGQRRWLTGGRDSRGPVLTDISFALHRGQRLAIIGGSGSGKSTLVRLFLGLLTPDSGSIRYRQRDITSPQRTRPPELLRAIQVVLPNPFDALNPALRIVDQVAEPLVSLGGQRWKAARAAALGALEEVGLAPDLAARRPHQISGGQAQRIAIARALILRPEILVCDEPVSSLDASVQAQILNLLRDLTLKRNLALLLISHDLRVVSYLCDRTAVLQAGNLVEEGPTASLLAAPAHDYTRLLLDSVPQAPDWLPSRGCARGKR